MRRLALFAALLGASLGGALAPQSAAAAAVVALVPWPSPPAIVDGALAAADASWKTDSGVTQGNYCPVKFMRHEGFPDAGSVASLCVITYNTVMIDGLIRTADTPGAPSRYEALVHLCVVMKHERGHILGYADYGPEGAGVMTPALYSMHPAACTAWALSLTPYSEVGRVSYLPPAKGRQVRILPRGCSFCRVRR